MTNFTPHLNITRYNAYFAEYCEYCDEMLPIEPDGDEEGNDHSTWGICECPDAYYDAMKEEFDWHHDRFVQAARRGSDLHGYATRLMVWAAEMIRAGWERADHHAAAN